MTKRSSFALAALLATGALSAQQDARVLLHFASFDPLAGAPSVPASLRAPEAASLSLLQVERELTDAHRDELTALGVTVHQFIPNRAYVVRGGDQKAAGQLEFVRWMGPFHTAYKLEPAILDEALRPGPNPVRRYNIVLVDKLRDALPVANAVRAAGGTVHIEANGGVLVEASMTRAQMLDVASLDTVLWIDRYGAPEEDIDNARIQFGANAVEMVTGIDGKGMTGHVLEGVYSTHPEFAARAPYRTGPLSIGSGTAAGHGNATAGEIFGRGADPRCKGMVPFAQLTYTNYNYVINTNNRYSLTRTLVDSNGRYKVRFQTASWGYPRTLLYTSRSVEMDDIIHDFDLYVTQSQSNAGATSQPRNSRSQAWSKNIASVGGYRHGDNANGSDDSWSRSGSTGPANDGRIGVTFSGYYDSIFTTGYNATGYTTSFGGTSGATPMVNGISAIGIQMFTEGHLGYPAAPTWQDRYKFTPHFTTTKAMLMATSELKNFATNTRYQQGWGTPHVKNLYDLRNNILVLDEEDVLQARQNRTYYVFVKPGTPEFRAAMTYADPEATANTSGPHRINSLDLSVNTPSAGRFWGNNGLLSSNVSTAGGSANDLDTEEMVVISRPASGVYTVDVRATAVRQDAHRETRVTDADFALAVAGIGGGRDMSGMKLDLSSARTGDLVFTLTGLPARYAGGYTLLSFDTNRHPALGNVFGLEADSTSLAILSSAQAVGNPLAFRTTASRVYPNAPFRVPAAVAIALRGRTMDGVAFVHNASGSIIAVSNVDRVTVR